MHFVLKIHLHFFLCLFKLKGQNLRNIGFYFDVYTQDPVQT